MQKTTGKTSKQINPVSPNQIRPECFRELLLQELK
jgi:hypothetical protein